MGTRESKSPDNNKIVPVPDITEPQLGNTGVDTVDGNSFSMPRRSMGADDHVKQQQHRMQSICDDIAEIPYEDYEYPFENLVFEGGGAKGQVYIGCLQILEELGISPKRVAGASAGAICAALTAVGFTAGEMKVVLESDLEQVLMDHSCGLCSLLPNLIRNFGWNPGNRFLEEMGALIERKGYNADITFKQLYKQKGIELCVTAVNVNMLSVEYFHPKTTPNMPIRLAVRMSLSIPGVFEAVRQTNGRGQTDLYIDGGLVCNYPIHAFDGWWLSMKKEDSFLNRIQPLSHLRRLMDKRERFGEFNNKTLGFVVYSALEQDLMQTELDHIAGLDISDRPQQSKLYQSRSYALSNKQKAIVEHEIFLRALDKFLKLARVVNETQELSETLRGVNSATTKRQMDDVIEKAELMEALHVATSTSSSGPSANSQFTKHDVEILFGKDVCIDTVFDELDVDDNGHISYDELMQFVERAGIDIQSRFQGYDRREVMSLGQYAIGLQDTLLTNVKKMFIEEKDIDRTIGINTDYIETTDFNMAEEDREFCYQRGRKATVSFLRHYVYRHKPPKRVRAITDEPDHSAVSNTPHATHHTTHHTTNHTTHHTANHTSNHTTNPDAQHTVHLAPRMDTVPALQPQPASVVAGPGLPPIRGKAKTENVSVKPGPPGYVVQASESSLRHDSPATISAITTETKAHSALERAPSSCSSYSSSSSNSN